MGSLLSGRTVFMQVFPGLPPLDGACTWSRAGPGRFKRLKAKPRRDFPPALVADGECPKMRHSGSGLLDHPGMTRVAIEGWNESRSAVAQSMRGALPLRDVVGDHAGRFHRRLAELGIARDFTLDALTFVMQQVAKALKLGNQALDFRKRRSGHALDQRVDAVDGGLGVVINRGIATPHHAWRRTTQISDVVANEIADSGLDLRGRREV